MTPEKQERFEAAARVLAREGTVREAARAAGVGASTVQDWKRRVTFRALYEQYAKEYWRARGRQLAREDTRGVEAELPPNTGEIGSVMREVGGA